MSFASLARAVLVVDETIQQQDQIREVFKRWLVDNSEKEPGHSVKWLMIFDNVDDHSILRPYWPSGSNGSVIVTTRDVKLARQYSKPPGRMELGPFSDSEAQKFLLSIIQIGNPEQVLPQQRLEIDLPCAATITHALGNLPLAIHLVGSYIATNGRSLLSFLGDNPTFEIDLISDDELRLMSEQDYERSIETTWTLQLASVTPQTQLLMDLIALFDADGAPTTLFQAHWQPGQVVDEQGFVLPDGYATAKLQDKTCL
ncbi:hypothetical protein LZ554_002979 [Drepanopeziza brunnea f. sp. 'monogermtubi']|nr:hypothetical protein LZ554_002979 [Drepanopeziza brunnea f. sp. 'monogermtubi']